MAENTGAAQAGPETGSFCWTEIASNDAAKCKEFYSNVFGWNFKSDQHDGSPFVYHEFSLGGGYPAGGLYELSAEMCVEGGVLPPPHFMSYIAVDDVDASASDAKELGGKVISEPMDIPNVGRFAIIEDPTGAKFSVFKMKEGGHHG